MTFLLSGFATLASYHSRKPTWRGSKSFTDEAPAIEAATQWLGSQGPEAQVEVIRVSGNEADVVAVVTQAGIERIG